MQTIISAVGVFISTSIDYLVLLVLVFGQQKDTKNNFQIYAGQYIGTAILVGVSLVAAYIVNLVLESWMVGILGIIPILLGIHVLLEDKEDEAKEGDLKAKDNQKIFWMVAALTIASGGDNIGVYIPYFAGMNWSEILVVIIVFIIGILLMCLLSQRIAKMPLVSTTIEKYEKIIVPLVLIPLGIYIMIENGTITYLLQLFQ